MKQSDLAKIVNPPEIQFIIQISKTGDRPEQLINGAYFIFEPGAKLVRVGVA